MIDVFFDSVDKFVNGGVLDVTQMVNGVAVNPNTLPNANLTQTTQQTPPVVPTTQPIATPNNIEPVLQVTSETGAQPIVSQDPNNDEKNFGNPVEPDSWAMREDTIDEFGKGGGVKQTGVSSTAHDKQVKAKRVGYRFTEKKAKRLHKSSNAKPTAEEVEKFKQGKGVYYENRKNRSDKKRGKNL